jgi:hypothetical protein
VGDSVAGQGQAGRPAAACVRSPARAGPTTITTYADLKQRSQLCALGLQTLGVRCVSSVVRVCCISADLHSVAQVIMVRRLAGRVQWLPRWHGTPCATWRYAACIHKVCLPSCRNPTIQCPHLQVWYGIMGLGGIVHTLNPRLSDKVRLSTPSP